MGIIRVFVYVFCVEECPGRDLSYYTCLPTYLPQVDRQV